MQIGSESEHGKSSGLLSKIIARKNLQKDLHNASASTMRASNIISLPKKMDKFIANQEMSVRKKSGMAGMFKLR